MMISMRRSCFDFHKAPAAADDGDSDVNGSNDAAASNVRGKNRITRVRVPRFNAFPGLKLRSRPVPIESALPMRPAERTARRTTVAAQAPALPGD